MSKNLTRKGLALVSGSALVVTSLVGVATPATAAAGDVAISPDLGLVYGSFNTDAFTVQTDIATAAVNPATLAYKIDNPDQVELLISIATDAGTPNPANDVILQGITSLGASVTINSGNAIAIDGTNDDGTFAVKFDATGGNAFTSLIVRPLWDASDATAKSTISIRPIEAVATASNDSTDLLTASTVYVDTVTANVPDRFDLGDGDVSVDLQAWVEVTADYTTIDANFASAKQTINWYDPKGVAVIPAAERFVDASNNVLLNDATTNGNLAATISFGKPVNLDQMDLTKWSYKIEESNGTSVASKHAFASGDVVGLSGHSNRDRAGKLYTKLDNAGTAITLNVAKDYVLSVTHNDTGGVYYGSVAYVPASNAQDADLIEAEVTSATNAKQTDADDLSVQLRTGVKAFTYTAQIKTADTTDKEAASIQVLAVVKAGSYLSTGGGYTVSGVNGSITRTSAALITTGFTNASGQFSVTVTSTNAATSESYTVTFYVLDGASDNWTSLKTIGAGVGGGDDTNAAYVATYEAGTATTLTPESSVVSGADVTAAFTVTDQFGVATNLRGTRAVSVELKSSNGTSLDMDAPVSADGTVSFKFKNYVVAGASDVLTATTYTGSALSPTIPGGALTKTVALYNPAAASAVQVPATLTGVITYDDFITGKATTAAPAPNDGTMTLTGTVVDANGSGVPAAVVTLEAAGFQFQNVGSTTYAKDKITVTASAAGVFNVNFWAQKVTGSTGTPLKVTTSDGKTATTSVRTYLPKALDGNNLKFELAMPSNVVVNTTYAVTAKLTDKWGNPVATTGTTVAVQGFGSVQINSTDNVTNRAFGRDGTSVVFLRSVKDIAGPGSVTASLQTGATYTAYDNVTTDGDAASNALEATTLTIAEIATDIATTAWDETKFTNSLSANVEVLQSAPAGAGKVNVGSFNGKLVVYASNLNGKRISWKVGGNWGSAVATSNYSIFNRPTPRAGVTLNVEIFVDGVKTLTKSVVTR